MKLPDVEDQNEYVDFFEKLEGAKEELKYNTFSVGLPTLEEVFVELSKLDDKTSKALTLTLQYPEGADAGAVASFPLSDGTHFEVPLPENKKGGENFTVKYTEYTVQIPENTKKGTKLSYNQNGYVFNVVVPEDGCLEVNQKVQIAPNKHEVIGRRVSEPIRGCRCVASKNKSSSSCKAMCGKSYHLKKRQKLQLCCQMISPMILIFLASLINIFFDSLKTNHVRSWNRYQG